MATNPTTGAYRGSDPEISTAAAVDDAHTVLINTISWGAVLAGVVAALITQVLLNMLGVGIGATTLDPMTGDSPQPQTFSIAAGIWWTVSGIIAAFVGGVIAGRFSARPKRSTGGLHGLVAWAVSMLIVFLLLATAVGGIVGGAFGVLGNTMGGIGKTAAALAPAAAQADPFARIENQLRANGTDPAALRDSAAAALRAAFTGDAAGTEEARMKAAEAVARAQNISVEEARARVGEYEQSYRAGLEEAKQQALQVADTASKAVARGAIFGFFALILGAIASWFGGVSGVTAAAEGRRGLRD